MLVCVDFLMISPTAGGGRGPGGSISGRGSAAARPSPIPYVPTSSLPSPPLPSPPLPSTPPSTLLVLAHRTMPSRPSDYHTPPAPPLPNKHRAPPVSARHCRGLLCPVSPAGAPSTGTGVGVWTARHPSQGVPWRAWGAVQGVEPPPAPYPALCTPRRCCLPR